MKNNSIKTCRCKMSIELTTSSLQFIYIPYRELYWRIGLLSVDNLSINTLAYICIHTVILLQILAKSVI